MDLAKKKSHKEANNFFSLFEDWDNSQTDEDFVAPDNDISEVDGVSILVYL